MRRQGDQETTIDQVYLGDLVEAVEDQTHAIREQTEALTEVLKHLSPSADSRPTQASEGAHESRPLTEQEMTE